MHFWTPIENRIYWKDEASYRPPLTHVAPLQDEWYKRKYFRRSIYHPLKTRCISIVYGDRKPRAYL